MSNELLAIIGGLVTFLLSVNGWYFRSIVTSLTEIKVTLAQLNESHENSLQLVDKHDREIEKMRDRLYKVEAYMAVTFDDKEH
jgi:uncharacterized alpha-E superfamily protein